MLNINSVYKEYASDSASCVAQTQNLMLTVKWTIMRTKREDVYSFQDN